MNQPLLFSPLTIRALTLKNRVVVAPLAMLGWGASLGGLVGAAVGAERKEGGISALIGDAIVSGQTVLVAETRTEQETSIASEVMKASVGDCEDVSAA